MKPRARKQSRAVAPQQPVEPDALTTYRRTVPAHEGCADCRSEGMGCLRHALALALVTSDAMAEAFAQAAPKAVDGERVPALVQTLRTVQALATANGDVLGNLDSVPGSVVVAFCQQVEALCREVLR